LGSGDVDGASARLEQATEIAEHDPGARGDLPRLRRELSAAYRLRGEWEAAVEATRKALAESNRSGSSPGEKALAGLALGFALLAKGDPSGALSVFEGVIGASGRGSEERYAGWVAAEGRVRALWMLGREREAAAAEGALERDRLETSEPMENRRLGVDKTSSGRNRDEIVVDGSAESRWKR
jgi:hypothetical protein